MHESIKLLRSGSIQWADKSDTQPWQEEWFVQSAKRSQAKDAVLAFWMRIGSACITSLCHIAQSSGEDAADIDKILAIPLPQESQEWLEACPPMLGGEYLNHAMLEQLWGALLEWCSNTAREKGSIAQFLEEYAPKWKHVGRIFFHLAENKMDEMYPFAFLATYTIGLNEQGEPRHMQLIHALKTCSATQDKPRLLHLLAPLLKAAQTFDWVEEMVADKSIYKPMPWTPRQAHRFLKSVEQLQEIGVGVRVPNWWKKHPRPQVQAIFNTRETGGLSAAALISVNLKVLIGDQQYSDEEIEALLHNCEDGLVLFKKQWIEVDKEKLAEALSYWRMVEQQARDGQVNFAQGLRFLAGIAQEQQADQETADIRHWSLATAGHGFQELLSAARRESTGVIADLQADLRPYQASGVEWLSFLGSLGLGACLADDMGLGKTMQILALLLKERDGTPNLLIAPASLLRNWQAEAKRFAPTLKLMLLHGLSKQALQALETQEDPFAGVDLVLVSYTGCVKQPWLCKYGWKRVIADEAQAIKNAQTKQSRVVRSMGGKCHIALTGTPIENRLSDLWALFDFLNPGLLGTAKEFTQLMKALNESETRYAPLRKLTSPYILRRMKTDKTVIDSLPDKTEVPLYCQLTKEQARLYVSIAKKLEASLNELMDMRASDTKAKRNVLVLQSLMLLKQVCNHPCQAGSPGRYEPKESGKFMEVGALCETIAERQEKVLVFTQFREIISPLHDYLTTIFGERGLVLHGEIPVKERQNVVNIFERVDGPPFMILTLRVGGTGLTLTEASHVIHFDRWWNPAVEDQATDRAYRIGQKKNVLVHKCVTRGTLEEKIATMIDEKRALAAEVLGAGEINLTTLSDEEIVQLVRFDATQMLE